MPFTLFCHLGAPDQALSFLREHGAAVEGDDEHWSASFLIGGGLFRRRKTIRLTYDREWCSPPNWPKQLAGMASFVSRFTMPDPVRRLVLQRLVPSFTYSIGIVTEPEIEQPDDRRLEIIHALAEHLDAVIVTPGSLLDPHFRAFADIDGELDENAEIPWGESGPPELSDEDEAEDEPCDPPDPQRVSRRLLALAAVVARGLLDVNLQQGNESACTLDELNAWVAGLGLGDELEPEEAELLTVPAGKLPPQEVLNAVWRVEGLAILAWALGLVADLPPYDRPVEVDALLPAVGFLKLDAARTIRDGARLRDAAELATYAKQILAYHWRLVDFRVRPEAIRRDEVTIFGPFDLTWAELRDGDLCLQGAPIAQAEPDLFDMCSSIAVERHRASSWLSGHARIYSEAPVDT